MNAGGVPLALAAAGRAAEIEISITSAPAR